MTREQHLAELRAKWEAEEGEALEAFLPELAEKIAAVLAAGGNELQVRAELRSALRMFQARRAEERERAAELSHANGVRIAPIEREVER